MPQRERSELVKLLAQIAERFGVALLAYRGGSRDGVAQRAKIIRLSPDQSLVTVTFMGEASSKTLRVDRIQWVADTVGDGETVVNPQLDPSLPALPRSKPIRIEDPRAQFADWAFEIREHHWGQLGLTYRQYMVKKVAHKAWFTDDPPCIDFLIGTNFYRGSEFLNVAFCGGDGFVEVHAGQVGQDAQAQVAFDHEGKNILATAFGKRRDAWLVRDGGLVAWLRTGERPAGAVPVDQARSSCDGVLRLSIAMELPEASGVDVGRLVFADDDAA